MRSLKQLRAGLLALLEHDTKIQCPILGIDFDKQTIKYLDDDDGVECEVGYVLYPSGKLGWVAPRSILKRDIYAQKPSAKTESFVEELTALIDRYYPDREELSLFEGDDDLDF